MPLSGECSARLQGPRDASASRPDRRTTIDDSLRGCAPERLQGRQHLARTTRQTPVYSTAHVRSTPSNALRLTGTRLCQAPRSSFVLEPLTAQATSTALGARARGDPHHQVGPARLRRGLVPCSSRLTGTAPTSRLAAPFLATAGLCRRRSPEAHDSTSVPRRRRARSGRSATWWSAKRSQPILMPASTEIDRLAVREDRALVRPRPGARRAPSFGNRPAPDV
jgi:hypothetical protein